MTIKFCQVTPPLSLLNLSHFDHSKISHSHNMQNSNVPNLSNSSFVLFPYVKPELLCRTASPSMSNLPRHIRQQDTYNDLKNLDVNQMEEFLQSYQTFKHSVCAEKNPTVITNPFYQWVIKHNLDAWSIRKIIIDDYKYEDSFETPPLWCQARMGQSRTVIPDGRIILIAGEYEDYYDPDFFIYNDVIVIHPDGDIDVYNYSKAIFAPTDFHSATLIGSGTEEHIIIIGTLGYPDDRQYSYTPVYKLNTQNFKMEQVATRNSMGWINHHHAKLQDNRIIIAGGQLLIDDIAPLLDNIDTWVLNLNTLIWKNSTQRHQKWQRFYVRRQDERSLSLWYYKQLDEYLQSDTSDKTQKNLDHTEKQIKEYSADIEELTNQLPDLHSYRQLLIPPLEHETYTEGHADSTINGYDHKNNYDHVLFIDDIKVGYKTADDGCIQVIIEGKLSEDKLELLQQNLRPKLSKVENMACEVIEL